MKEIKKQENLVYKGKSKDVYNIPLGKNAKSIGCLGEWFLCQIMK